MNPDTAQDIRQAADVMRRGGVVIYPTDTIWGIGCDARSSDAVKRVFELKRRAEAKALITLVDSLAMLERCVDEVPEVAYQLIDVATDPLTLIYDRGIGVAPELLAPDGSLGVRLTREPFSAALCRAMRGPVVSTSANYSGHPSPATFADIDPTLLESVDYVCTSRRDENAPARPSGIIKISASGLFKIIR